MIPKLQAIIASLEYFEAHIHDPVTVQDLARIAGYSLYHFIRIFNQSVGFTPYDYMIRRRLTEASHQLIISESKILDLATAFQFGSHESFTRAFVRMFTMTPTQWREEGVNDIRFGLPPLGVDYLNYFIENGFPKPTIIVMDRLSLAGWMLPVEKNGKEFYRHVQIEFRNFVEKKISELKSIDYWGIRIYPNQRKIPMMYFLGIDLFGVNDIPSGFASYTT